MQQIYHDHVDVSLVDIIGENKKTTLTLILTLNLPKP